VALYYFLFTFESAFVLTKDWPGKFLLFWDFLTSRLKWRTICSSRPSPKFNSYTYLWLWR